MRFSFANEVGQIGVSEHGASMARPLPLREPITLQPGMDLWSMKKKTHA